MNHSPRHGRRRGAQAGASATGRTAGVRRPLRFLSHKLGLDRQQTEQLAAALAHLKIERAQAQVDRRRAQQQFADAVAAEVFDEHKISAATQGRLAAAERVNTMVVQLLRTLHADLDADQRAKLVVLLRAGPVLF
jgi:hypothetical protein